MAACFFLLQLTENNFRNLNTPGMIRTCDLLIRSQALYPAELRVRESESLDYKLLRFAVKFIA
jgi:hypothetical protein